MTLTVDLPKLRESMQGFHTLTGLKIVLFDADYREVLACPATEGPFCRLLRSFPASLARCGASNVQSFRRCRKSGELTIYRCHAGLFEATAPIADHGVVRGYVMFGQITDQGDRADFATAWSSAVGAPGRRDEARDAVASIRSVSAERIHAATQIMEACVCYLLRHDVVAFRKGRPSSASTTSSPSTFPRIFRRSGCAPNSTSVAQISTACSPTTSERASPLRCATGA